MWPEALGWVSVLSILVLYWLDFCGKWRSETASYQIVSGVVWITLAAVVVLNYRNLSLLLDLFMIALVISSSNIEWFLRAKKPALQLPEEHELTGLKHLNDDKKSQP